MPAWLPRRRALKAVAAEPAPLKEAPAPHRALVAAATRLTNDFGYRKAVIRRAGWQTEAWRQYDLNGELRYAVEWMANSLSRVRLIVAETDDAGRIVRETDNQAVLTLMADLLGDPTFVSQMMHCLGQNLGVAGDVYLVEFGDEWIVNSTEEISDGTTTGTAEITYEGDKYVINTSTNIVLRIHRPHPRKYVEANSPTRGALPVLRTIEQLAKYRDSVINSRLAGAGILGIASELSFARAPEDQSTEDPFMEALAEGMLTPIRDQGDPAAQVPNVIRGPKEFLPTQDNWITNPRSDLTMVTADLEDRQIVRLATALDIPAEVLTGSGDASRWATWQTEETAIKIHVEPLVILICQALTEGVLEPYLTNAGIDTENFVVWFDASELIQRPNRSVDAQNLYDKGLLSESATRRECGFPEEDAPQGEEKCRATMYEVLRLSPRFADDHLAVVARTLNWDQCGIDIDELQAQDDARAGVGTVDAGGTPPNGDPAAPTPDSRPRPSGSPDAPTAGD